MSWLMAKFYDRMIRSTEDACLRQWRRELLQHATGHVLEIGAGTGGNLPHYPRGHERLVLCEPNSHMRAQLAHKVAQEFAQEDSDSVEVFDFPAERLGFDDASFDTVVSTLVLCSVQDPEESLKELRRVLRSGGSLLFLEHVAAEDRPDRLKWQRRIEPMWKTFSGNCHLTRRTEQLLVAHRFAIREISRESLRKAVPCVRPSIRGVAVKLD